MTVPLACAANINCLREIVDTLKLQILTLHLEDDEWPHINFLIDEVEKQKDKGVPDNISLFKKYRVNHGHHSFTGNVVEEQIAMFSKILNEIDDESQIKLFMPIDDLVQAIQIINKYNLVEHKHLNEFQYHPTSITLKDFDMGTLLNMTIIAPLLPESLTEKLINNTLTDQDKENLYIYAHVDFNEDTLKELTTQLQKSTDNENVYNAILENFYHQKVELLTKEERERIKNTIMEEKKKGLIIGLTKKSSRGSPSVGVSENIELQGKLFERFSTKRKLL